MQCEVTLAFNDRLATPTGLARFREPTVIGNQAWASQGEAENISKLFGLATPPPCSARTPQAPDSEDDLPASPVLSAGWRSPGASVNRTEYCSRLIPIPIHFDSQYQFILLGARMVSIGTVLAVIGIRHRVTARRTETSTILGWKNVPGDKAIED